MGGKKPLLIATTTLFYNSMNRAAGGQTTESAVGILKDVFIPRNSKLKSTDAVMH